MNSEHVFEYLPSDVPINNLASTNDCLYWDALGEAHEIWPTVNKNTARINPSF